MNEKIILAFIGGLSLLASGAASALVVGGVDFGEPATSHIETTTLAETLITDNGQTLTGYGQVNTVNGEINYAGTDRLYYTFTDYVSANFSGGPGGSVDFTGGVANLYLGNVGNLLDASSATNITDIQALGTPWLTVAGSDIGTGFTLHADGTLIGVDIAFNGSGLLDVTGGLADVVAFFNTNLLGIPGDTADMTLTTDGANRTLNPNDNLTGCAEGTALAGQFCIAGSATFQGPTATNVPEPGVIALLGMGLLGFAYSLRKNKAA
jgi:hypothetical protein